MFIDAKSCPCAGFQYSSRKPIGVRLQEFTGHSAPSCKHVCLESSGQDEEVE